jgi:leader peptidase (prepilin peptidase) / N-methyltransferase
MTHQRDEETFGRRSRSRLRKMASKYSDQEIKKWNGDSLMFFWLYHQLRRPSPGATFPSKRDWCQAQAATKFRWQRTRGSPPRFHLRSVRVCFESAWTNPTVLLVAAAASAAGFLLLAPLDAMFGTFLALSVLVVAATDLARFEIPDLANCAIFLLGIGWVVSSGFYSDAILDAVLRAAVAAAVLEIVRLLYRRLRGIEGLGMGDVKLAAASAPWLTWSHLQVALLIAVCAALIVVTGRALIGRNGVHMRLALPFGAFLAPAVWVVWFAVAGGL